jgi:hypothetical protein
VGNPAKKGGYDHGLLRLTSFCNEINSVYAGFFPEANVSGILISSGNLIT